MGKHPRREGAYRAQTAKESVPSVTSYSWTCRVCQTKQYGMAGRKKLPGEGWSCSTCAREKK